MASVTPHHWDEASEAAWNARVDANAIANARAELNEAIDILVRVVQQVESQRFQGNVEVADDDTITAYRLPVGPVHAAIPFLARQGIRVDQFGAVHRG